MCSGWKKESAPASVVVDVDAGVDVDALVVRDGRSRENGGGLHERNKMAGNCDSDVKVQMVSNNTNACFGCTSSQSYSGDS